MNKKTEITVADQSVRVVEYRGQRVVTLGMIDQVHGRPDGTARGTFNSHKDKLIEGEDYFVCQTHEAKNQFGITAPNGLTILTESGYLMVVKTFTDDLAWQVQRQLVNRYFRKDEPAQKVSTSNTTRGLSRTQVAASILLLRSAAEDLKLAPSAVLGGYQKLEEHIGIPGLLPAYAIDAPSTGIAGSIEVTKAAGDLLEEHGVSISAIAFNRLLVQHGFLEERERPSSKGGTKKFKVCTDMEYGKNLTNPNNPRETQPHWYVSKFAELLELVMPAKPEAVA